MGGGKSIRCHHRYGLSIVTANHFEIQKEWGWARCRFGVKIRVNRQKPGPDATAPEGSERRRRARRTPGSMARLIQSTESDIVPATSQPGEYHIRHRLEPAARPLVVADDSAGA